MRAFAAVFLIATAVLAQSDVADEADLQFQLGTESFRARDYRRALEHFLASNRLAPNRNVVYDIAESYEHLGMQAEAYRYYAHALQEESDAKERAKIERALQRISPLLAILRVVTDPPGATLYVDRKDLGSRGQSPAVFAVPPGKVKILAELEGHEPGQSDLIDAKPGLDLTVHLTLPRIERAVKLTSTPAGAKVSADSGESCDTPCEVSLPVGKVSLTAEAAGFGREKRDVYVTESENAPVDFELKAQTGRIAIETDERGAAISVDRHLAGFTPAVLDIPVGIREIRVELPGYAPATRTFLVSAGEQPSLIVELEALDQVSAASRTAESMDDAPSSVTVISGKELRAMAYPTLFEALRGTRGVFLSDDTTYDALGFRGYGPPGSYGNKVLVLLDGHSTNDDWIGSSYVGFDNRADLDDIDRIEIVRGPGSVLYGTGAFAGVINVVTRPKDSPQETSLTLGSPENGAIRARAAMRRPNFEINISGVTAQGRDFDGSRGSDGFQSGTLNAKAWFGDFTVQAQSNARDKALPLGEFDTLVGDPRTHLIDRRAFVEARYEPKLGDSGELFARIYWDRYTYDSWLMHDTLFRERFFGDWAGAELRVTWHVRDLLRATFGGEGQWHYHVSQNGRDEGAQFTYLRSDDPFGVGAGYADLDFTPAQALHLSAGARLDHFSTFGNSVSPRFAIILKPNPTTVWKAMAGRAFRAPSIYELDYNDGGLSQIPACPQSNPRCLQPETIWSGELELTRHLDPLWTGVGSFWVSRIEDVIELDPALSNPAVVQYRNISNLIHSYGFEAELRREWRQGFYAMAQYSYAHVDTDNSPTHMGSLKIAAPLLQQRLNAMTRLSVEGARTDREGNRTSAAVLWDVVLTFEISDWHTHGALGLYNAADWKTIVPASPEFGSLLTIPQRGRSLIASITVGL
jgi:outer membrane receptor for ferrienterochelin and colicins